MLYYNDFQYNSRSRKQRGSKALQTIVKKSSSLSLHVVRCAVWNHFYYFKNAKNTHGGVLFLVLKVTLFHGYFSRFFNSNGTKSWNALAFEISEKFIWFKILMKAVYMFKYIIISHLGQNLVWRDIFQSKRRKLPCLMYWPTTGRS